jgi:hypothetical protein
MSRREYIITLKNKEDLPAFYNDMETRRGTSSIPTRAIPVKDRRPVSRNTHYLLSESEAIKIKKDPRVLSVELSFEEQGIKIKPSRSVISTLWNKSNTIATGHQNWGLLRCTEGTQRSNWGNNGTTNVTGTATLTSTGKHVDVVVVDGHFDPTHAEFAVNNDGTGGSRVNQFNWYSLNPQVIGDPADTYVYTPYVDGVSDLTDDNNHGSTVAGVVAGNTRGWASDATIYNISPYGSNPNYFAAYYVIGYLRAWHNSKLINPVTGRKNPTISNHSYGAYSEIPITSISQVRFQGTVNTGPFTSNQLSAFGIFNYDSGGGVYVAQIPARSSAFDADLIDAMDDGIIIVAASGNQFTKIDNPSSDINADYNNFLVSDGLLYYYNRGSTLATPGTIQVSAIGITTNESKVSFSNCGPRVDIYAPGTLIMTTVNSGGFVNDARDPTDRWTKVSGTSFSSPQVAGALACLAEQWPTMTQAQALRYITENATVDQIADTEGGPGDDLSLQGSENRYLYYVKEREEQGQITPRANQGFRPTSGMAWPRPRIYRYGR